MGDIRVKFKATRKSHVLQGRALVDSGAQTSVLNMDDACRLGLDVITAERVDRSTVGDGRIAGFRLQGVRVEANGRKAVLDDVFVPVAHVRKVKDKKTGKIKTESRRIITDEPLLGQDFLQASKSFLDFSDDTLKGIESLGPPISLSRKFTQRPASKKDGELIVALAMASCPRPKPKKR